MFVCEIIGNLFPIQVTRGQFKQLMRKAKMCGKSWPNIMHVFKTRENNLVAISIGKASTSHVYLIDATNGLLVDSYKGTVHMYVGRGEAVCDSISPVDALALPKPVRKFLRTAVEEVLGEQELAYQKAFVDLLYHE